jgi:putative intracellular protease/amidase
MKTLLTILTNAAHLTLTDGEEYPSGFWAEEFAVPYQMFKEAGYVVDFATLGGIAPTVDKSSIDPDFMKWVRPSFMQIDDAAAAETYRKTIEQAGGLRSPKDVARLTRDDIASYDGIYIVGGHGCMEDMPASPPMTRFLLAVLALNKPLASVCHGPTAFLSPRDMAGQSPFAGYRDRTEATRPGILQGPLPLGLARRRRPQPGDRTESILVGSDGDEVP